jgi:hypothetical protein
MVILMATNPFYPDDVGNGPLDVYIPHANLSSQKCQIVA